MKLWVDGKAGSAGSAIRATVKEQVTNINRKVVSRGSWLSSSATIATPPLEAFSLFTCPFQCIRRFPVRLAGGSPGADAV